MATIAANISFFYLFFKKKNAAAYVAVVAVFIWLTTSVANFSSRLNEKNKEKKKTGKPFCISLSCSSIGKSTFISRNIEMFITRSEAERKYTHTRKNIVHHSKWCVKWHSVIDANIYRKRECSTKLYCRWHGVFNKRQKQQQQQHNRRHR